MAGQSKPSAMSLYADLLEPEKNVTGSGVIASAPVRYNMKAQEVLANEEKKKDGAYQIPAYLRPQISNMKAKPTQPPPIHKSATIVSSAVSYSSSPAKPDDGAKPVQPHKSKFEDWVGREDEEIAYQKPSWQRQKKNKKKKEQGRVWTWNDIYDPSLPNNYADYKGSEEQFAEIRDWKARLYYHQLKEIDEEKKQLARKLSPSPVRNSMFAPPPGLSFAPPSFDSGAPMRPPSESSDDDYYPPAVPSENGSQPSLRPVTFAASTQGNLVPDERPSANSSAPMEEHTNIHRAEQRPVEPRNDANLDNAPSEPTSSTTPQPLPTESTTSEDFRSSAMAKAAAIKAKLDASIMAAKQSVPSAAKTADTTPSQGTHPSRSLPREPLPSPPSPARDAAVNHPPPPPPPPPPPLPDQDDSTASTISRAPVRYTQAPSEPPADAGLPDNSTPQASSRPGQKNFAERYMQKFGYEKGKGLGAQGEGIVTPIIMKAEKRKKRSDAEGGGWAVSANMGKIVGGKKRKLDNDVQEAEMSAVIKIPGMVSGLDIDHEMQENNLMQRIGDTLSQDHGNIERIFIWRQAMSGDDAVFVKFNSAVSALGAVNRSGGITFAGNAVTASFYDAERFDKGEYA